MTYKKKISTKQRQIQVMEKVIAKMYAMPTSQKATTEVYSPILEYATTRARCCVADVWSVDPTRRRLILVKSKYSRDFKSPREEILKIENSLTGHVVETKRIDEFDVNVRLPDGRQFQDKRLLQHFSVNSMLSVPIINTSNPHQVLCVLNFLTESAKRISREMKLHMHSMSTILASVIEGALREHGYRMSMMLGQDFMKHSDEHGPYVNIPVACNLLARRCVKATAANRAIVYLKDPVTSKLQSRAAVNRPAGKQLGAEVEEDKLPSVPEQVRKVYDSNREYLAPRLRDEESPESLVDDSADGTLSCVLVPIHDLQGRCQGVIQCIRDATDSVTRFTYDDIAVLEAISQAFIRPLESLLETEKRRFSQQKLTHELRVPVSAFRVLLAKMQEEVSESAFRFRYPHFREGRIYTDLMTRLLKELDIARFGPSQIPMRQQWTNVETEVIIPAKRFTLPLLRERGFYTRQLNHEGFEGFSKLYVDPALVTQVVFNLLDNAIKYYDGPKDDFRCSISGTKTARHYEIRVADNGPGVSKERKEEIFEFGVRGDNRRSNAFGEGLGLWISQAVVKRHGGDLFAEDSDRGAVFVLQLPRSLASTQAFQRPIQGL